MGEGRGRGLHEDVGKRLLTLGSRSAALGDVRGVVAGQQQELPRPGDRHQEANVVEGDRELLARELVDRVDPVREIADSVERLAVGRQEIKQVVGRRQVQVDARQLAVGLGRLVDRDYVIVGVETRQYQVIEAEPAKPHARFSSFKNADKHWLHSLEVEIR